MLLWQYPTSDDYFHVPDMYDTDRAGEWHEQDMATLWHQDAYAALSMLSGSKLPSMFGVDGGYVCSKSIYPQVKRKHTKVMTYDNLLKKCSKGQMPLYKLCGGTMVINTSTNTITIEA